MEGINLNYLNNSNSSILSLGMPLDNFAMPTMSCVQQTNILAICHADEASKGATCYVYSTCFSGSRTCGQRRQAGISEDVSSFVREMKQHSSEHDDASHPTSEETKDVKIDATLTITSNDSKKNTWCGFVSDGALFLRGDGWADMDIRESVVAALDLAEEQLGCTSVHLCLEKSNPNLAKLVRTLMYAGFEMVHPDVLGNADPKYLVLGMEV
ncbi:hypothetical protein BGZ93_006253 [Podila epicladia]|nr:hypothetical protein BGZ93_006253 [Podila epicladia]